VIDLDTTDDPLHGHQEGRFFHGFYGSYCYLPLFAFVGSVPLWAQLRTSDGDAARGAVEALKKIVAAVRKRCPKARIIVRADSGFCREEIMAWCAASQSSNTRPLRVGHALGGSSLKPRCYRTKTIRVLS